MLRAVAGAHDIPVDVDRPVEARVDIELAGGLQLHRQKAAVLRDDDLVLDGPEAQAFRGRRGDLAPDIGIVEEALDDLRESAADSSAPAACRKSAFEGSETSVA
jgi:hypothetical protein